MSLLPAVERMHLLSFEGLHKVNTTFADLRKSHIGHGEFQSSQLAAHEVELDLIADFGTFVYLENLEGHPCKYRCRAFAHAPSVQYLPTKDEFRSFRYLGHA